MRKILVVEDNEINRIKLCNILQGKYEPLAVENGLEAFQILEQYGEEISLILLDLVMPVMDGYTFLTKVKADSAYAAIPVIITTQNDDETEEVTALSYGAADFVAKPYKPQIILHRVASIINLRETAAMINLLQYDRLTGLYTREFFYQRVKETLHRNSDKKYDLICSNIVNFKLVNDVFGIPAGDELLKQLSSACCDFAGEKGLYGRLNGDIFACLMEQGQKQYSNELFMDITSKLNSASGMKNVTVKWGIYAIDNLDLPVEQMCDRALLAANSIKERYGVYYAFYDEKLRGTLLREQAITNSMERALEEEQFEIYLQPQFRIDDSTLSGAEVLIRWNHPKMGLLFPDAFIPLFEKNGFITRLDYFVWRKACETLRRWDEAGLPQLSVSVNVSRADIYNVELNKLLTEVTQSNHIHPSRLHLEITESAYTENPRQMTEAVLELKNAGFIIEMDDFGSGYSSLNTLNQMKLDVLKLDREFIWNETGKTDGSGILRFVMDLARGLGLKVVAEGVETVEQLNHLRELDCDYAQGYYFAKPMPVNRFEEQCFKTKEQIYE